MLSSFREVLKRPGARPLTLACLLGWFSAIGVQLAVVLAVQRSTGSFALAGAASATQSVASAAVAPFRGRLVDQRGSAGLGSLVVGLVTGTALFIWGCLAGIELAWFPGVALMGGLGLPLIGIARARWSVVVGPELAPTAHAINAAMSDCAQLGSPTLVAIVSLAFSPLGALAALVFGACSAAGILMRLGLPRQTRARERRGDLIGVLRGNGGLQAIVLGDLAMGVWSGGMTITVVAVAARQGQAALGGLLLAAGALGSIVTTVFAGSGRLRASTGTRYVAGAGLCTVGLLVLFVTSGLPAVAVAMIVVGAGLGLENVAVFQALDVVSPSDRSTEAFTWLTTSSAAGGAIGAAVSGELIHHSTAPARLFILATAGVGAAVLFSCRRMFNAAPEMQ